MGKPDEPRPLTDAEKCEKKLRDELAKVNALLDRADILYLKIETVEQALIRKHTIEWFLARLEQLAEQHIAGLKLKKEESDETVRQWQARLASEPALRREVERRRESDELQKKFGLPRKEHGPWPPPPRDDEQK